MGSIQASYTYVSTFRVDKSNVITISIGNLDVNKHKCNINLGIKSYGTQL